MKAPLTTAIGSIFSAMVATLSKDWEEALAGGGIPGNG
jgi:hypothetical protein